MRANACLGARPGYRNGSHIIPAPGGRSGMNSRTNALVWRLIVPAAVALLPLSLVAQGALQSPDEVLKQESYQTPSKELADAVLATRYLNVSLTNASHDKKWFVDEIGDGPVVMKTFAKPFHELGGLFVDFKANRARPL